MDNSFRKAGQVVEIPRNSKIYGASRKVFLKERDNLDSLAMPYRYDLFDGMLIGSHFGLEDYKIGQRKGLQIGGKTQPLYVIGKDSRQNRLFVGAGHDHPGLYREVFFIPNDSIQWSAEAPHYDSKIMVKTVRGKDTAEAEMYIYEDGIFLKYNNPSRLYSEKEIFKIVLNEKEIATVFIKNYNS